MNKFSLMLAITLSYSGASLAEEPQTFQDCQECPKMIILKADQFTMGDLEGRADEQPLRHITVPKDFAVSVYETTFAQWDKCREEGYCTFHPDDHGWGRDQRPVIGPTYGEINDFIKWLNSKASSGHYRLPNEAEWEFFARAGTSTAYSWGDDIDENMANCDDCESQWDEELTAPVGSFKPNNFGLYDVHGNVWEWTLDCYDPDSYQTQMPTIAAVNPDDQTCKKVIRGGGWRDYPNMLRSSRRAKADPTRRYWDVGFRVVKDLL